MRRALLVFVILLAACGGDDDPSLEVPTSSDEGGDAGAGGSTTEPPATFPTDVDTSGARPVEVRGGLDDPGPTAIEGVTAADDTTLVVRFYNGVQACYGVDRVDVTEAPEGVTVGVFTGRLPESRDQACIEIAELQAVAVALATPLAGRPVVDASTGDEVPVS